MLSNQDKAVKLMTCRDLKPIARYVYEAFEERKIMIDSLATLSNVIDIVEKQEKIAAKLEADVKHVIGNMIKKIETSPSAEICENYAIQNVSNNGLKFTIHKKKLYTIKDISKDGLKIKIRWEDI